MIGKESHALILKGFFILSSFEYTQQSMSNQPGSDKWGKVDAPRPTGFRRADLRCAAIPLCTSALSRY